jgi:hypothetical protein
MPIKIIKDFHANTSSHPHSFNAVYTIYETSGGNDDYRAFSYMHRFEETLPESIKLAGRILGTYRGPRLNKQSRRVREGRRRKKDLHYFGMGRIRRYTLKRFGFLPSYHWFSDIDANLYSAIRWISTWKEQQSKAVIFAQDLERGLKLVELIFLYSTQIPNGIILVLLDSSRIDPRKLEKLNIWGVTVLWDASAGSALPSINNYKFSTYEFNSLEEMPLLPKGYASIDWLEILTSANLKVQNPEKVLFIRPDWMKCGSATTFAKLTHLFQSRGSILIDIALQPYQVFCDRTIIAEKLAEVKTDLSPSFHINLRRSFLPSVFLRTVMHLLMRRSRTVAGYMAFFYRQCSTPRKVRSILHQARIDYLYVNHYFTLPMAQAICPNRPVYLDTHDIQSLNFVSHDYHAKIRRRASPFTECLKEELAVIDKADRVTMVSRDEIKLVKQYRPDHDFFYYIPLPDVKQIKTPSLSPRNNSKPLQALIVASRNPANERSLKWFLNAIWPKVMDLPFHLMIAGNINISFPDQSFEGVTFTGMVDDLQSMYHSSDLIILPITNGGGIAIKTLEALQAELPISCTRHAMRGLPLEVQQVLPGCLTDQDLIDDLHHVASSADALMKRKIQVKLAHKRLLEMNFDAQMHRELDWMCTFSRKSDAN